jgi:5-methylcytosine-specific restriction endonuclease McrA
VVTLRPVLTRENLDELVARAAYLSDDETAYLVASLRPGQAPREGIRKLPVPAPAAIAATRGPGPVARTAAPAMLALPRAPDAPAPRPQRRETLQPVSAELYSLRVDMTPEFKADLERLRQLRSHAHRDGNTGALLHEAVRCALDHYGKRVGTVEPKRARKPRKAAPAEPGVPPKRRAIPLHVRRAVWARDGGQCTYVSPDGKRCDCRWQLELDHIDPDAKDKVPTADDLRLRCRAHNILAAEEHYGRELMLRCRGRPTSRTGESALASESDSG